MIHPRRLLPLALLLAALPAAGDELPCHLDWAETVTLGTPLSGRLAEVKVRPGEMVERGQLLASLDLRPLRAEVQRAEAVLAAAQARRADAQRAWQRARDLYDREVLSTTELQAAEVRHDRAEAAWQRARAELTRARLDLEYARLRAPWDGLVVDRLAEPGETLVNALVATPVLRLARPDRWRLTAWLPAAQARGLGPGTRLTAHIAGRAVTVTLYGASGLHSRQGPAGREVAVTATLPAPDPNQRPALAECRLQRPAAP